MNWLGDSKPNFPAQFSRILYAHFYASPGGAPVLFASSVSDRLGIDPQLSLHDYRSLLGTHVDLLPSRPPCRIAASLAPSCRRVDGVDDSRYLSDCERRQSFWV